MSLKAAAEKVRAAGRGKDTELVHFTKGEVAGLTALARAAGGNLTRNPKTGMVEAGFLSDLLPTILGTAAMFIPGMQPVGAAMIGAATGAIQNKKDPLMGAVMGGLGGYGGAGLGAGLQGAGAGVAQQAAMSAVPQGAAEAAVGQGLQATTLAPGLGLNPAVAPSMVEGAATGAANQAAADATTQFLQKPFYEQAGAGLQAAVGDPGAFLQGMGGPTQALKTAGMAAAPALYGSMMPGDPEGYDEGEASDYSYDAGFTGGTMTGSDPSSERDWFDPTFTRLAEGGATAPRSVGASIMGMTRNGRENGSMFGLFKDQLAAPPADAGQSSRRGGGFSALRALAAQSSTRGQAPKYNYDPGTQRFTRMATGGSVGLAEGGFIIPADVVSMVGNGSSDAGLEALAQHLGAVPIDGPGDGMSDSIPADIDGQHPAAVARQEAYLSPDKVQAAGGEEKLYELLQRVRQQAHGTTRQQRPVRAEQVLS